MLQTLLSKCTICPRLVRIRQLMSEMSQDKLYGVAAFFFSSHAYCAQLHAGIYYYLANTPQQFTFSWSITIPPLTPINAPSRACPAAVSWLSCCSLLINQSVMHCKCLKDIVVYAATSQQNWLMWFNQRTTGLWVHLPLRFWVVHLTLAWLDFNC